MTLSCRLATSEDLPAINVIAQVAGARKEEGTPSSSYRYDSPDLAEGSAWADIIVLTKDTKVIGFAPVEYNFQDRSEADLCDFVILPEHRHISSQGIPALVLINAVKQRCSEKGIKELYTELNENSRLLAPRFGFRRLEEASDEYMLDISSTKTEERKR